MLNGNRYQKLYLDYDLEKLTTIIFKDNFFVGRDGCVDKTKYFYDQNMMNGFFRFWKGQWPAGIDEKVIFVAFLCFYTE